jgi:signal transduction histidine kinase
MLRRTSSPGSFWAAGSAMLVLLALLATLQYRWLGKVSDAEKQRMLSRMQAGAARFARDFDQQLTRALVLLGPVGAARRPEELAERRERWTSSAITPELVRGVFVASADPAQRLSLAAYDSATGRMVPAQWPTELLALKSRLGDVGPVPEPAPGRRRTHVLSVPAADVPALVAPYFGSEPATPENGYTIVWLDRDVLFGTLIPELAARHFAGAEGLEYRVEIASVAYPSQAIYRAGPSPGGEASERSDVEIGVFGLLRADELDVHPHEGAVHVEPRPSTTSPGTTQPPRPPPAEWRLRLTHPSGSLEAAVASTRNRNLAISFGTLLSLALGMTLLLVSARRAQRLARQQLEFTAGVTHELATPLAGMRSAAQNLADGVVKDPAQVRDYGALIEREGRRLTEMVEQVLTFAGMQSGTRALANERVAVPELIEDALASWRRTLDQEGFRVDTEIAPDLPDVRGDGPALRRAIDNLIGNAVKYASSGAWLGIRAAVGSDRRGRWIEVAVDDSGPGIDAGDLPHVFEPFYRGRDRAAGAVPGSGLGLTMVRTIAAAHGGRVDVRTQDGKGCSFRLVLPLADGEPAPAPGSAG